MLAPRKTTNSRLSPPPSIKRVGRARKALSAAAAVLAVGVAACGGSSEEATPVACLAAADAYVEALSAAPASVLIDGETPISGCLISGQAVGAQNAVGIATVEAATKLNAEARRRPDGQAAVQLGYLIGAIQQGASETGGIHTDLVRRLDAAGRFNPGGEPLSAAIERELGRGYAAGQTTG